MITATRGWVAGMALAGVLTAGPVQAGQEAPGAGPASPAAGQEPAGPEAPAEAPSATPAEAPEPEPAALINARVRGHEGPVTVLLAGGRIAEVAADLELPEGVQVLDVEGRHVVPGLIDGLAYHDPMHELLYAAAGVTTIRDHGNDLARVLTAAAPATRAAALGPRISTAGAVLDGSPPTTGAALVLRDAHEAEHRVAALAEQGVDFLALQVNLGREAFDAALAVARERDLQVWGPVPYDVELDHFLSSAEAGLTGLLFLDRLLPADSGWDTLSDAELDAICARVAASGLAVVPLLAGTRRLITDPAAVVGGEAAELLLVGPEHAGHWRNELELRRPSLEDEEWVARGVRVLERQGQLVARLHAAGVPIVPGSGAPHPWLLPGRGLHAELGLLVEAGLSPAVVFELATSGAARTLGMQDLGRVEPGALADLLVVAEDPRESLAALDEIDAVVLGGRVFEWPELDRRMAELEVRLAALGEWLEQPLGVGAPELPDGATILAGLAESSSVAGRLAQERFAAVREYDDSLSFVGRRATRTAGGEVVVEVLQRTREGELEAFEIKLLSDGHELLVRGALVAGQMRVERRIDGQHAGTFGIRERLVAVDAGSITTALLLGQREGTGPMPVLRFDEALELEVVRWELAVNADGDHVIKLPTGLKLASFQPNGAPRVVVDQTGSGAITTQILELDTFGGAGLGLPPDKLARVRAAQGPAEASAPSDR